MATSDPRPAARGLREDDRPRALGLQQEVRGPLRRHRRRPGRRRRGPGRRRGAAPATPRPREEQTEFTATLTEIGPNKIPVKIIATKKQLKEHDADAAEEQSEFTRDASPRSARTRSRSSRSSASSPGSASRRPRTSSTRRRSPSRRASPGTRPRRSRLPSKSRAPRSRSSSTVAARRAAASLRRRCASRGTSAQGRTRCRRHWPAHRRPAPPASGDGRIGLGRMACRGSFDKSTVAVSYSFCERGPSPFPPTSVKEWYFMLSVAESAPLAASPSARTRYARIPEVLADPEPDRAPARVVPVVHREGPPGAVRRDQPDQGLHRQGDGAPVPRLRVRGPQVLRGGVPDQGPDLQPPAVRATSSS